VLFVIVFGTLSFAAAHRIAAYRDAELQCSPRSVGRRPSDNRAAVSVRDKTAFHCRRRDERPSDVTCLPNPSRQRSDLCSSAARPPTRRYSYLPSPTPSLPSPPRPTAGQPNDQPRDTPPSVANNFMSRRVDYGRRKSRVTQPTVAAKYRLTVLQKVVCLRRHELLGLLS